MDAGESFFFSNPSSNLEGPALKEQSIEDRWRCTMVLSEVRLVRETLAEALESRLIYGSVVGVGSLGEAAKQMDIVGPDLVLVDATLRDGLAAVRWLHQRDPASRLMAFNVDEVMQDMIAWTGAGILAYIGRSGTLKEIIELISTRMDGERATDGRVKTEIELDSLSELSNSIGITGGKIPVLTGREEEVAQLLIAGDSNKEIARLLNISVPTVKSHVHNLLGKLGLQRRGKLALQYVGAASAVGRADRPGGRR
jgi:two-component system, NarL family, nitrate/nitrite response regulator NarL